MAYRVLPYLAGSRGATALAAALPGGRCLRLRGSQWRPRANDVVINWGNADGAVVGNYNGRCQVLNGMDLRTASNKLTFFRAMRDSGNENIVPRFWTNRQEIPDDAFPIVCRTVLAGHSGDGIVIARTRGELVAAPLYVQYVKKTDEYRVHVGRGDRPERQNGRAGDQSIIIAVQRKARNRAVPDDQINWQVRNHHNGFVFVRGDVAPNPAVLDVARRALDSCGLDFGAVDVIWNERHQRALVLEINTAPGLEGQTVEDYANFFRRFG